MQSLRGKRVLVTRPAHQADEQIRLLQQAGAQALPLPLLKITPTPEDSPEFQLLKSQILDLDLYQKIIFISANAVHYGFDLIDQYWPQLPVGIDWLAIGKQTAATMATYQVKALHSDSGYDSESLLASEYLQQVADTRILIMRGQGGRETLAETLRQRGAQVDYADLYLRSCPDYTPQQISSTIGNQSLDAVIITSGEALQNLTTVLADRVITQVPLVVPGQRVAQMAKQQGFTRIIVAPGPDSETMVQSLLSNLDMDE